MRTSVRVHENAHSSRAERQEEVIHRGVNVTRRRGRPRFEATNEQRRAVEILVGLGIPQAHIRRLVRDRWDRPISENTLRKYFKPEIARGAAKVNALMGLFIVKTILGKAAASRHLANHRPQCQRRLTELFARAHMGWPTMAAPGRQAVAARHLSGHQRLT